MFFLQEVLWEMLIQKILRLAMVRFGLKYPNCTVCPSHNGKTLQSILLLALFTVRQNTLGSRAIKVARAML